MHDRQPTLLGRLGDRRDCALRAYHHNAAVRVGAGGIELLDRFLTGTDAYGIGGRAKVIDEFWSNEEEAEVGLVLIEVWRIGRSLFAIVSDGGVIGLRGDFGKRPGFAGIVGECEVGAVLFGMFVVSAGDDAVEWVAKGDGENSGRVWAVDDRRVEDLPGLAAVGRVEDAGGFAAGGEPDVGIGG